MSDAKTETPPGYPEGWQPEEIRTIEPQPLPKDQQPDPVLTPEQATEWNRLQSLYPHDPVVIEWDDNDEPTFITPDGEDHPVEKPKAEKTEAKQTKK